MCSEQETKINHYKLSHLRRLFNSKTLLPSIKSLVSLVISEARAEITTALAPWVAVVIYHRLPEKRLSELINKQLQQLLV